MADEKKVAAARVAIARGFAEKNARGGRLEVKGYRPRSDGSGPLKSEIPGYDAFDRGPAAAYMAAAEEMRREGLLSKLSYAAPAGGGRRVIGNLRAKESMLPRLFEIAAGQAAAPTPAKAVHPRKPSASKPSVPGSSVSPQAAAVAEDPRVPAWARAWAREASKRPLSRGEEGVLAAIGALSPDGPRGERELSVECWGDTKYFHRRVRGEMVRAVRANFGLLLPGGDEGSLSDDEVLLLAGVRPLPREVLLGGPVAAVHPDGAVDFRSFGRFGGCLSDGMAAASRFSAAGAKAVLAVENKACYHAMLERFWREAVVVFTGGIPSPAVLGVLSKISSAAPAAAPRLVWADVDAGGFEIAADVMESAPDFGPFLMGLGDMARFDFSLCRRPADAKAQARAVEGKMARLKGTAMENAARAVVFSGMMLEQEAMLGGYAEDAFEEVLRRAR